MLLAAGRSSNGNLNVGDGFFIGIGRVPFTSTLLLNLLLEESPWLD